MEKDIITQYFEDVETTKEYKGYFCSVAEAITIVILGSICVLKNLSQIHQWTASNRTGEFLKEKLGSALLLPAPVPSQAGQAGIP